MTKYNSFKAVKQAIYSGETNCLSLVKHYLEQIEVNKNLNVFLEVYANEAIKQAENVDQKIKDGTAGRLAGMVIGLKDVLAYENHGLQASSKILGGFQSQFTATAVERILAEDAIIIGRQNCD